MKVPYKKIRSSLRTFDAINCEHRNWFWRLIGHVAMVYVCPLTGQVFVYESTQMSHAGVSGVQLTPMGTWLKLYPGVVKIRRCVIDRQTPQAEYPFDRREQAERYCSGHIKKYRGTSYPDLSMWKWRLFMLNATLDIPFFKFDDNPDTNEMMQCAQLFGDVYRYCGLTKTMSDPVFNPAEMEPDNIRPKYYPDKIGWRIGSDKISKFLADGVTLADEEIQIK